MLCSILFDSNDYLSTVFTFTVWKLCCFPLMPTQSKCFRDYFVTLFVSHVSSFQVTPSGSPNRRQCWELSGCCPYEYHTRGGKSYFHWTLASYPQSRFSHFDNRLRWHLSRTKSASFGRGLYSSNIQSKMA